MALYMDNQNGTTDIITLISVLPFELRLIISQVCGFWAAQEDAFVPNRGNQQFSDARRLD